MSVCVVLTDTSVLFPRVLRAAVAADIDAICTANVRDFPAASMIHVGINIITPDSLLQTAVTTFPRQIRTVRRQVVTAMPHSNDEATLVGLKQRSSPAARQPSSPAAQQPGSQSG